MGMFNDKPETRARLGKGSALYTNYFNDDGLFSLLIPTVETPFIGSDVSEVEIKVSSASTVTKIAGVKTLNSAETTVYMHRDCARLLEKVNGKTIDLISMVGDFIGYKYNATITYTPSNAGMDDAWQGTIKLTPKTDPVYIDNCKPLLKPTAFFDGDIDAVIELDTTASTYNLVVATKHEGTTVGATCEDTNIATATIADNKLTITGKKEGSTIVNLKTAKEGYASWETSILVIVPKEVVSPASLKLSK